MWAKVFSELTGVDQAVISAAVKRGQFKDLKLAGSAGDVIAREQLVADAFSEAKLIPVPVKIADVVDTRFDASLENPS